MNIWNNSVDDAILHNRELVGLSFTLCSRIHERVGDTIMTHPVTAGDCSEFAMATNSLSRGFTTISTIGLFEEDYYPSIISVLHGNCLLVG